MVVYEPMGVFASASTSPPKRSRGAAQFERRSLASSRDAGPKLWDVASRPVRSTASTRPGGEMGRSFVEPHVARSGGLYRFRQDHRGDRGRRRRTLGLGQTSASLARSSGRSRSRAASFASGLMPPRRPIIEETAASRLPLPDRRAWAGPGTGDSVAGSPILGTNFTNFTISRRSVAEPRDHTPAAARYRSTPSLPLRSKPRLERRRAPMVVAAISPGTAAGARSHCRSDRAGRPPGPILGQRHAERPRQSLLAGSDHRPVRRTGGEGDMVPLVTDENFSEAGIAPPSEQETALLAELGPIRWTALVEPRDTSTAVCGRPSPRRSGTAGAHLARGGGGPGYEERSVASPRFEAVAVALDGKR